MIDFFGWQEDLKIAEQVADNKAEEDEAGDGHNGFLTDRGLPETQATGRKFYRSSTHGM